MDVAPWLWFITWITTICSKTTKEKDRDYSKAGGDKLPSDDQHLVGQDDILFFCFCGVDNGAGEKDGCFVVILFFCGGWYDDNYNTIIDCNWKNRLCIAVCIALLRE